MRPVAIDGRLLYAAAAAALAAAGGALYWWRRGPVHPAEIERQRRLHLNQVGRIIEGQVIELLEAAPEPEKIRGTKLGKGRSSPNLESGNGRRRLVCYSYSISGVTYETAQDITGLEERLCLERLVAGQPASIKYDPANPSNSILVADDWSGLR